MGVHVSLDLVDEEQADVRLFRQELQELNTEPLQVEFGQLSQFFPEMMKFC